MIGAQSQGLVADRHDQLAITSDTQAFDPVEAQPDRRRIDVGGQCEVELDVYARRVADHLDAWQSIAQRDLAVVRHSRSPCARVGTQEVAAGTTGRLARADRAARTANQRAADLAPGGQSQRQAAFVDEHGDARMARQEGRCHGVLDRFEVQLGRGLVRSGSRRLLCVAGARSGQEYEGEE